MVPSVLVLLADGFEEIEAITPIDLLKRSGADVTVAGVTGISPRGSHGLVVACDALLGDCRKTYDCVILPGGGKGSKNLASSYEVLQQCIKTAQKGLVAAICAAPGVVLGKTGLLEGHRVTGFPGTADDVPSVTLTGKRVEVDGNIITAKAAGCAVEFALAIIEYLFDHKTSEGIAAQVFAAPVS